MREGGDVTILCYSRMRYVVMQAVQQLEKQGYDPEVRVGPDCWLAWGVGSVTAGRAAAGEVAAQHKDGSQA